MASVLLFNIDDNKGIRIKNLCRRLYFECRDVEKSDFGRTMGFLLSGNGDPAVRDGADFDEEMLYLADIDGGMLSIFLSQLRRIKAPVALKAVKTDTNTRYTAYELYRDLSAERDAIANGGTFHEK